MRQHLRNREVMTEFPATLIDWRKMEIPAVQAAWDSLPHDVRKPCYLWLSRTESCVLQYLVYLEMALTPAGVAQRRRHFEERAAFLKRYSSLDITADEYADFLRFAPDLLDGIHLFDPSKVARCQPILHEALTEQ
jgi:hypothetical protein